MAYAHLNSDFNYLINGSAASGSFAFDCSTGSNRLLIAIIADRSNLARTINTVTYNGVALTQAGSRAIEESTGLKLFIDVFYLINPATGSNTLYVEYAGEGTHQVGVTALVFSGGNQSAPYDQQDTDLSASGNNPSLTLTPSENDCLLIAGLLDEDGVLLTQSGGTTVDDFDAGAFVFQAAYFIQTTAASKTISWSGSTAYNYVAVMFSFKAAATSNNYQQSVGGAISPGGGLSKLTARPLAGAASPVGTITKAPRRSLAGSISPSGVVGKLTGVLRSGVIAPLGNLSKQIGRGLAGSIAPTGVVSRLVNYVRALAGEISPSGNLARQISKGLAGAITPTGALAHVRVFLKSLAGAISPSGEISRSISRSLGGTLAPLGGLIKQISRSLAGAISPGGTIAGVRAILVSLGGAISPSGEVSRSISRSLAGALTPLGGLIKQIRRTLAGAISPSGQLSTGQLISMLLEGVIAPTGEISRSISRSLAGAITPAGALLKRIGRTLRGILSASGSLAWAQGAGQMIVRLTLEARDYGRSLADRFRRLSIFRRSNRR